MHIREKTENCDTNQQNQHRESEKTETHDGNQHLESAEIGTHDRNQHMESKKTEILDKNQHLESKKTETRNRNRHLESENMNSHSDKNNCNILNNLKIVEKIQCNNANDTNNSKTFGQKDSERELNCVSSSKLENAEVSLVENILQKQGSLYKIPKKHLNKKEQDICVDKNNYFETENESKENKSLDILHAVKYSEELVSTQTLAGNTFEQKEIQDIVKSIENTNNISIIQVNRDLKLENKETCEPKICRKDKSMQDEANLKKNQTKTRDTEKSMELEQSKNLESDESNHERIFGEDTNVSETYETKTSSITIVSKTEIENETNNFESNNLATNFKEDNGTHNIVLNVNAIDTEENISNSEESCVVNSENAAELNKLSSNETSMDDHNGLCTQIPSFTSILTRNRGSSSSCVKATICGESVTKNDIKENKLMNNSGKIQDEKYNPFSNLKNLKILTIPCMSALEYDKECEVSKYNEYLNSHSNYCPDLSNQTMHEINKYDSKQSEEKKLTQKCEIKTTDATLDDSSEVMDSSAEENSSKVEEVQNIESYTYRESKSDIINKNELPMENIILNKEVKKENELDIIPTCALKQLNELFGDDEIISTVHEKRLETLSLDQKSNKRNNLDFGGLTNESKYAIQPEKIDSSKRLTAETSYQENENQNMSAKPKSECVSTKDIANSEIGNRLPLVSFKEFAELHCEENMRKENEHNLSNEKEYKLTEYEKVNISKIIDAKSDCIFMLCTK
ncbi:protein PF3D7_1417600-like [Uloborus diversus]|uniref:protein PF3D7_1417600-like n=1 Tax=Uloborus diversus TaxID=327109 RepID=UPI00240A7246|nr:protein PF3D7_1417600-like [Uloborus diversus]